MSRIRLLAVCAGFGLEAYDWGLYPLLLCYFGPSFFGGDPQHALFSGFAVFAAGFLTRPLGGLVLGRYADTRGRRPAMRLCLAGAGIAALGMALTPSGTTVGVAAPILVLLWRTLLGFSFGGETPLGHSYMYEMTPQQRRGAGAALLATAACIGGIVANLLVLGLVLALGPDGMAAGGWRIPFLVGALASMLFAALRGGLAESGEFELRRHQAYSWWSARRSLAVPMLSVAGVTIGAAASFYLWSAVPTAYAITLLHLDDTQVLLATSTASLVNVVALPLFGRLGDRVGCARLLSSAATVMTVAIGPLLYCLDHGGVPGYWIVVLASHLIMAGMVATMPAVLAGLVPARYRVTAEALPYTAVVTLFGGTMPMLKQLTADHPVLLTAYVMLLLSITVATTRWADRREPADARPVLVPPRTVPQQG
ncbi:MFS transporter [Nocardia aurantia]|uniref:Proline/betaine transporter n=1 Tax=Nocardia aurantia TaxID=2585199 RepID=A0A7K0DTQ7_9NOCA|nr:MFS transporter [Nocardia aurantia]MQY29149.1 Proline/betaine transporter [Nocardia aurantia]